MDDQLVMGIDGGGSTVRVGIYGSGLTLRGQATGSTANPSVVGQEAAAQTIQVAMRAALDTAGLSAKDIAAAGIGVAGAAVVHSEAWLLETVRAVLPEAVTVPSSDYETALTGAFGERCGVLVLAGTGSFAYGVNAAGRVKLSGGWGYLLGDEGSGYWLGMEGLRAVTHAQDGTAPLTSLSAALLDAVGVTRPLDFGPWLYRSGQPRTRDVARLAPIVLDHAAAGDAVARSIIERGVSELASLARAVCAALEMDPRGVKFAGGLLSEPNLLSSALSAALELPEFPRPLYSPLEGAALLAQMAL